MYVTSAGANDAPAFEKLCAASSTAVVVATLAVQRSAICLTGWPCLILVINGCWYILLCNWFLIMLCACFLPVRVTHLCPLSLL